MLNEHSFFVGGNQRKSCVEILTDHEVHERRALLFFVETESQENMRAQNIVLQTMLRRY